MEQIMTYQRYFKFAVPALILLSLLMSLTMVNSCSPDEELVVTKAKLTTDPAPEGDDQRRLVLDFGNVVLLDPKNIELSLTNSGSAPLHIQVKAVNQPAPDEEPVFDFTPKGNQEIPPQKTLKVTFSFIPKTLGQQQSEFMLYSDDPEMPQMQIKVYGNGVTPEMDLCIESLSRKCSEPFKSLIHDFGVQELGTAQTVRFSVTNTGEWPLSIRKMVTDTLGKEFSIKNPIPDNTELESGKKLFFEVTYTPKNGGTDNGTILLDNNDPDEGPINIELSGIGNAPAICPDPLPILDFGFVRLNTLKDKVVTLENCGYKALNVQMPVLDPGTRNHFNFTTPPSLPALLQPGEMRQISITYAPKALGNDTGELKIDSNDPINGQGIIQIKGNATDKPFCELAINPGERIDFGQVASRRYTFQEIYITNVGQETCTIKDIDGPTPSGEFSIMNQVTTPVSLKSGDGIELRVKYAPVDKGRDESKITLGSSDPGRANVVLTLVATGGGPPVCTIVTDPSSNKLKFADGILNFGSTKRGSTRVKTIRIHNKGSDNCKVDTIQLAKSTDPTFLIANIPKLPLTLLPNRKTSVDVSFKPKNFGQYGNPDGLSHNVLISTTDINHQAKGSPAPPKGTFVIGLTGQCIQSKIEVIPAELDFGEVTMGCNSMQECIHIYNTGSANLSVTKIHIDKSSDPDFNIVKAPNIPANLTPGNSIEICLRYNPKGNRRESRGMLIIENTDKDEPKLSIPLKGKMVTSGNQKDIFSQLERPQVDVLFAVDNSGSMSEEQDSLAKNFDTFIQQAVTVNVDYHIGVTTSEVNKTKQADKKSGHPGMDMVPGGLFGNPKYITPQTPNQKSAFSKNIKVGTCCSDAKEAALQASKMALSTPMIDDPTKNGGFMRKDAKLVIICLSDEEDQSDGPVDLYINFFKSLKGFRNTSLMDVNVIVGMKGPNDSDPNCKSGTGSTGSAKTGHRYIEVAQRTGGLYRSICSSNWGKEMADIGRLAFGIRVEFFLTRPAKPGSIKVQVDGQVSHENVNWSFDLKTNSIIFNTKSAPRRGSKIEVEYEVGCVI